MEQYIHEEIQTEGDIPFRFGVYRDSCHLVTGHWHNSLEVVYICGGQMDVTVSRSTQSLTEGCFTLINSADIHSTYCHEDCRMLLLQIPYDFLRSAVPGYDCLRFEGNYASRLPDDMEKSERVRALLLSMKEIYEKKPEGFSLRFSSLVYEFLYTVIQCYKIVVDTSDKIRTDKNLDRLKAVMDYVRENYSRHIALTEAAAVISLNPEYFCRFFKKYMGLTFLEYVNKVRLSHVYEDLTGTDLSVTDILSRNGCTAYKQFMRSFKATYGCTPAKLRHRFFP